MRDLHLSMHLDWDILFLQEFSVAHAELVFDVGGHRYIRSSNSWRCECVVIHSTLVENLQSWGVAPFPWAVLLVAGKRFLIMSLYLQRRGHGRDVLSNTLDEVSSFLQRMRCSLDALILGGDLNSQLGKLFNGANDHLVGPASGGELDERSLEILNFMQEWELFAASTALWEVGGLLHLSGLQHGKAKAA